MSNFRDTNAYPAEAVRLPVGVLTHAVRRKVPPYGPINKQDNSNFIQALNHTRDDLEETAHAVSGPEWFTEPRPQASSAGHVCTGLGSIVLRPQCMHGSSVYE